MGHLPPDSGFSSPVSDSAYFLSGKSDERREGQVTSLDCLKNSILYKTPSSWKETGKSQVSSLDCSDLPQSKNFLVTYLENSEGKREKGLSPQQEIKNSSSTISRRRGAQAASLDESLRTLICFKAKNSSLSKFVRPESLSISNVHFVRNQQKENDDDIWRPF